MISCCGNTHPTEEEWSQLKNETCVVYAEQNAELNIVNYKDKLSYADVNLRVVWYLLHKHVTTGHKTRYIYFLGPLTSSSYL